MRQREIRSVDLGDGTAVWVQTGQDVPASPQPRRPWRLWAGLGVGLATFGGAAFALLG
jgi:hypothetical protein